MEKILQMVDDGEYEEALLKISALPEKLQRKGRIMIAKADAVYELCRDLEAMELYGKYLKTYPSGRGRDFALMGIVACLKNLDMQAEAKMCLDLVDDQHVGKEKEAEHSLQILKRQEMAKLILMDVFFDKP